ncbi:MAG TPA: glycosyltransferase [Candidatus Moranbacteria bacterium]|nr:glycosyltransferase [Candidatus Moranbacteria bacterium]
MILARRDENYRRVLSGFSARAVDGVGLVWAGFLRGRRPSRLSGADFFEEALRFCAARGKEVFFVCRRGGLTDWEKLRAVLCRRHPGLRVRGGDFDPTDTTAAEKISADAVFCNFGPPEQEFFLSALREENFSLAVGVGGAFDFFSGRVSRAGEFWRRLGLEWLWRTICAPRRRWRKFYLSLIVFPAAVLRERFAAGRSGFSPRSGCAIMKPKRENSTKRKI